MLSGLDESLWHQTTLPFSLAATSDHRFYDRMLVGAFHPDGEAAIITGIGYYKNMNVADAFVIGQLGSQKQHNLRLSQALDRSPRQAGAAVGPLRSTVIEPFREVRLTLDPSEHGMAFDLWFRDTLPPFLEDPHQSRLDGRQHTDYLRFQQVGVLNGWAEIGGSRIEVANWFCWRDHSWGVRPGIGGFEPQTGTPTAGGVPSAHRTKDKALLLLKGGFWNGREGGGFQLLEDGSGHRFYTHGALHREGEPDTPRKVLRIDHDIRFRPGTRVYEHVALQLELETDEVWSVELESVGRPLVYRGAGYDSGFWDGKGLGAWRGADLHLERDTYDVSDHEAVVLESGEVIRPHHREQFAHAVINGKAGFAYTPFFVIGAHPRFDLFR